MLKDIMTIKVQGASFDTLKEFPFFNQKDGNTLKTIKGALLYGRNGTGKSTIAKAFRKAKGETLPAIRQVSFFDKEGNVVALNDDEKKQIYVFDEDYINNQVRLKEDHLETIIMLGPAAGLADKIAATENTRDVAKGILVTKEAAVKEYQDTNNPKSPKRCLWKIADALRGDDAWAGRDRRINGGRLNTQVRDETYKRFYRLAPTKTKSQLLVEYEEQMEALEIAKSGSSKIETRVPMLATSYNHYDDDTIIALLAKKIEKPELSEREHYLLGIVESGKATELSQKAAYFRKTSMTFFN